MPSGEHPVYVYASALTQGTCTSVKYSTERLINMSVNKYNRRWFGTMLDCSRNAVMTVDSVKQWIDITADLGYNMLMLYTEDTYEVKNQPYFGYMRGRYSISEMKEINAYCASKGMELIPNIQTLAHLNAITRWPAYAPIIDQKDFLLVGDERVYDLIDDMFATVCETHTSQFVHVGMDEAKGLGRGKYQDIHGICNVAEMFVEHIKRVAEIGKKYGKTILVWGDMFHTLMGPGKHENLPEDFDRAICDQIPDNVEIVCWEYDKPYVEFYDGRIKSHNRIRENTWYTGAFRSWLALTPRNAYTLKHIKSVMTACQMNQVRDLFFAHWGNDGAECSKFAFLPSLFYAAQLYNGVTDEEAIKKAFQEKFGIPWDDFMLLDLPDGPNGLDDGLYTADKYLLYNDPFIGLMDSTLDGTEDEAYALCAKKLGEVSLDHPWAYLFETQKALSDVLAIKANLGPRTRSAYEDKDHTALKKLIAEYEAVEEKLDIFYRAYCKQWYRENKGLGFEVQDAHIGGLKQRIRHCKEMLIAYESGQLSHIDELEEKRLDFMGNGENFTRKHMIYGYWDKIISANMVVEPL